jgi:hypothetical protein
MDEIQKNDHRQLEVMAIAGALFLLDRIKVILKQYGISPKAYWTNFRWSFKRDTSEGEKIILITARAFITELMILWIRDSYYATKGIIDEDTPLRTFRETIAVILRSGLTDKLLNSSLNLPKAGANAAVIRDRVLKDVMEAADQMKEQIVLEIATAQI